MASAPVARGDDEEDRLARRVLAAAFTRNWERRQLWFAAWFQVIMGCFVCQYQ